MLLNVGTNKNDFKYYIKEYDVKDITTLILGRYIHIGRMLIN